MSILTAIFQAIGQALSWVLPVSESGHSAIFHNFSGRFTNACSQLTGVIHIGIAIGIFVAFIKLFILLFKNFAGAWGDIFKKKLDIRNTKPARGFMYMTVLSFVPMLVYLIPVGKGRNIFSLLHSMSYNEYLIDEGIFFIISAAMLFAVPLLEQKRLKPLPDILKSLIIGFGVFFAFPIAGFSLTAVMLFICILVGFSQKNALRYWAVMSVMILLAGGIAEICLGVTKASVVGAIIALILSAVASYFASKLLIYFVKNKMLKYFGVYDLTVGVICLIIGIFEFTLNK